MTLATASNTLDLLTLRCRMNLTQQELATMLGVTTRTIRKWEQGGPMHLIWQDQVESLGRPTVVTDPTGNVSYLVYNDTSYEVRLYAGWQSATNLPAFRGGVRVTGHLDWPVTRGWGAGTHAADLVNSLGGTIVDLLEDCYPTVAVGHPDDDVPGAAHRFDVLDRRPIRLLGDRVVGVERREVVRWERARG